MKKHILILFLLSIVTLSAFGQAGSLSQSVYRSRVNDSTTVNGAHASGYGDFFWNNQDTNPGWRVWNGTSYDIGFSAGGNFWKNAGTTTLTGLGALIDFSGRDLTFSGTEATIDLGPTPNGFIARGNFMQMGTQGDESYIQFSGTASADVLISTADDINIGAGQSGSGHDVNITSNYGHTHITTGTAGTLWTTTGPFNINTDPGTAGEYLKSNGAGAAPTWDTPAGGGGATAAGATGNIQYKSAGGGLQAEAALTYDSATNTLTVAELAGKYRIDQATPSTAGSTVTLDMNSQIVRTHVGSAPFSTPKTYAISNTTNSLSFQFTFTITDVAAVITVPSDWAFAPSAAWDGTDYTFSSTGTFVFGGDWDGTNWNIKVAGPFSN